MRRRHLLFACALGLACCASSPAWAQASGYTVTDLGLAAPPTFEPLIYACNLVEGGDKCPVVQMVTNGTGFVFHQRSRTAPGRFVAYYWEPGMTQPALAALREDEPSHVVAMSSNGFVVGVKDSGVRRTYRWSRSTGYLPLDYSDLSYALSVNAAGLVVGQQLYGAYRALMWNNSTAPIYLDDLNISGKSSWVFQSAYSITDDGVIAGVGLVTTSGGATETHGFLLTPTAAGPGALDRRDWTVTATESSPSDPPKNAIDGNLSTRWSTGKAQHDSQGFIVSWPGDRTIGRLRMEVGPSTNDYPRTCGIWVKDTVGTVTFVNCVPDVNGNVDVSFAPIPASKIEVWQWGTSSWWWSIAEFNVFSK
jgi:hypothetical protein